MTGIEEASDLFGKLDDSIDMTPHVSRLMRSSRYGKSRGGSR